MLVWHTAELARRESYPLVAGARPSRGRHRPDRRPETSREPLRRPSGVGGDRPDVVRRRAARHRSGSRGWHRRGRSMAGRARHGDGRGAPGLPASSAAPTGGRRPFVAWITAPAVIHGFRREWGWMAFTVLFPLLFGLLTVWVPGPPGGGSARRQPAHPAPDGTRDPRLRGRALIAVRRATEVCRSRAPGGYAIIRHPPERRGCPGVEVSNDPLRRCQARRAVDFDMHPPRWRVNGTAFMARCPRHGGESRVPAVNAARRESALDLHFWLCPRQDSNLRPAA